MGILFKTNVGGFGEHEAVTIGNRRIIFDDFKFMKRADLTFTTADGPISSNYPYLEDPAAFKQLLPLPSWLLRPLLRYRLPYQSVYSDELHFRERRTVIYIHGSGSFSEDNSLLHRLLLQNECDLVRISYHIDYAKEGIRFPKKAGDMLPFLNETEYRIAPILHEELTNALMSLSNRYPDLFTDKEVIIIAHSLGGALAANLLSGREIIQFDKFINLDGTLMNPAIQTGLRVPQLHLSQSHLFAHEWVKGEDVAEPRAAVGQDYGRKINALINRSEGQQIWVQIGNSSHFTFTDFPDLLQPYGMLRKLAGDPDAAQRIRNYVVQFILEPQRFIVGPQDNLLLSENA